MNLQELTKSSLFYGKKGTPKGLGVADLVVLPSNVKIA
jgi:hypothetical protein